MTPLALWTGRLPGLRPLPQPWTFWATGGVVALGAAGAFGLLGVEGPWLGIVGSFAAGWTLWRHRWPGRPPVGLKPLEAPQGADERTVVVEFRHEGVLLGWDVGILWFERGGVGFVGRTVSFVLPRALMHTSPWSPFADTALRAPRFVAEVYGTALAFVPVARESHAHMTLARIDALPEEITSRDGSAAVVAPPRSARAWAGGAAKDARTLRDLSDRLRNHRGFDPLPRPVAHSGFRLVSRRSVPLLNYSRRSRPSGAAPAVYSCSSSEGVPPEAGTHVAAGLALREVLVRSALRERRKAPAGQALPLHEHFGGLRLQFAAPAFERRLRVLQLRASPQLLVARVRDLRLGEEAPVDVHGRELARGGVLKV